MIGVKKEDRIYVHCPKKAEYAIVLRWKAQQKHRWKVSQNLVLATSENEAEWKKYEKDSTLGIYDLGGLCRLEKAKERGIVISFEKFMSDYQWRTNDQPKDSYYTKSIESPIAKEQQFINPIKKENNMKSIIKNNFVPSTIANDSIVLTMDGKVAYLRKDGDYTRYDKTQGAIIACSIFPNFKIGKMSFLVPTAYDTLKAGDVILHKGDFKEVVSNEGSLKAVNLNNGALSTIKKEIVEGFNFANIQKVTTLIGGDQASTNGLQFNPLMLMLFDKKGKGDSFESVLPFLLMNQAGGTNNAQALLPFLLLGDNKDDKMLQMMLLSGGFNNVTTSNGAINPAMFLLMGDGDIDPMMFMAMQGGFGGNTSANGAMNPMMLAAMASKGGDIDPMMMMLMSGQNPFTASTTVVAPVVEETSTEESSETEVPAGAPSYADLLATIKNLSEKVDSLSAPKKSSMEADAPTENPTTPTTEA